MFLCVWLLWKNTIFLNATFIAYNNSRDMGDTIARVPTIYTIIAWHRRLTLVCRSAFHLSTSAMRSSALSHSGGERAFNRSFIWSHDMLYWAQVTGYGWQLHMRKPDFPRTSCCNSGSMRRRVVIHENEIWSVLTVIGGSWRDLWCLKGKNVQ